MESILQISRRRTSKDVNLHIDDDNEGNICTACTYNAWTTSRV